MASVAMLFFCKYTANKKMGFERCLQYCIDVEKIPKSVPDRTYLYPYCARYLEKHIPTPNPDTCYLFMESSN